jgi:hypothetical protein
MSFIAQKDQGKVTKNAMGDSVGAISAARSNPNQPMSSSTPPGKKRWACGGPSHGNRNDRKARSKHCEAWTFTCAKRAVKGHYTTSCSKCSVCGAWGHHDASSKACLQGTGRRNPPKEHTPYSVPDDRAHDNAGYVYDQLCTTSEQGSDTPVPKPTRNAAVGHHVFEGKWIASPSKPQSMLSVLVKLLPNNHASFGFPIRDTSKLQPINIYPW